MYIGKLAADIEAAVERLSQDGIDGWGLQVCKEMEAAGKLMDLGGYEGCTDTCAHWDHSPAAPTRRWVPRSGTVVYLGYDYRPGDARVVWFAHILGNGEDVRYVELIEPPTEHWSSARYVESVPDWVLADLAERN